MTKRPYIPSISEQPYTTLPSASVRVLLIEDDASYAGLVKILLNANSEQHCEVVVAGTLQGGLQLLSERSDFDAVLLDLNLPDSAGLTTLHTLLHDFPATNVIVLTGSANAAQGLQAVGDGAQDYLVKGEFEPSQLSRILRFSMERRQILTRLEEAQAMAHVGNWEIRPDQDYCYISKEIFRILEVETEGQGLTYDELCASPFSQLHYLLAHEKTAAGQVDFQQELTWEARDGSQRYAQLSSRKTINRYGQTTYQGTLQDQTIQKRAQELQRAQEIAQETARVREQVIANVSHELRTPMNAILGMSDLLADTKLANEQRDYLDSIQDASQLLLGIINDILLTSSLQNGSVEISTAVFDLPLAVRRVVEMLQPKARAKGLYLNFNIAANIPTFVEGDKLRLSQILYNIVGNAIKFTERGGVAVQIDSADRRVIRFQVADTGPGIPPEQLESVFGAFNRINRPGKLVEGTGLGLNIAKKLAHQMGGDILLTSTLGEGATFTLELPFQYPEQQAVTAFQTNEKPAIDTSKAGRLLVVEDNLMNQIVLRKTLQGAWPNLEVTIATTGKEAIECLHSTAYDLVFMDIQLPDMDGFAITRYLRTQRSASRANIPVLAMTAQTQVTEDERFQEVDMTDYILKPFNRDQLFEKMSAFL